MTGDRSFASSTIPRHLARGVLGFGALIGAVALLPVLGPASLLLAPAGAITLRGCPMCWAIGLAQTVSRGRLERSCTQGRCKPKIAPPPARHAALDDHPVSGPTAV
ncbi:hypothetical protein [Streptomyces sp. ISID311]|uniref:hypothetical protein n=1 Tax=Streptomyces sp. ISID311 TaxID=2601673 RepID=UPI0011BD3482|nr:hypothetical protein [Streptomyces sp. ISID311]TXC96850.1 hypothetical protein FS847_17165 [Streptomyces sp. ISID311]